MDKQIEELWKRFTKEEQETLTKCMKERRELVDGWLKEAKAAEKTANNEKEDN